MIERYLPAYDKSLRKLSLTKYIREKEACSILNIEPRFLKHFLIGAPHIAAIETVKHEIYIHPDSLAKFIREKMKLKIKKEAGARNINNALKRLSF